MVGEPAALYTGVLPPDTRPGDQVLITIWPNGSAEFAHRRHGQWSPPEPLLREAQ